jgi:hypothetical protein
MKKTLLPFAGLCLLATMPAFSRVATTDILTGVSGSSITWTTSTFNNGFGHKIYGYDPGGKTDLRFAVRHNATAWTDMMTLTSEGRMGLGTMLPISKLHIVNPVPNNLAAFIWGQTHGIVAAVKDTTAYAFLAAANYNSDGTSTGGIRSLMVVKGDGKVGIGNIAPTELLQVESANDPYIFIRNTTYTIESPTMVRKGGIIFGQQNIDKTAAMLFAIPPGYHVPGILFCTKTTWNTPGPGVKDWNDRMFIHPNGNVGIGTIEPQEKLSVRGTVRSEKVKVTQTDWSDFVFQPGYALPSLDSVKQYINQHRHLPEIPSEKEVMANGQDLGEMNKKLLQKVEELTLYLIEMKARMEQLEARMPAAQPSR